MARLFAVAYIAGGLWLGGWELAALITGRGYTISELTWRFEGVGWTAARYLVLASFTFLTLHLALRWLR
jgi:hypothetical protein